MTVENLLALLPLEILASAAVIIMLVIAFHRSHALTAALTFIALALALASLFAAPSASPQVTTLLVVDGYARFFLGLILAADLAVLVLAYGYLEGRTINPEEFYLLLLLASLGSGVLVSSSHLASFFLGLEILSVSLYAMIAYLRAREEGVEAGIKYLILAGSSSAFLLFGMALVYAETGTLEFSRFASPPPGVSGTQNVLLLTGMAMIIVGAGFKLALVPFHLWTPDVYEGAPAPVTAFIATISKGAMFALILRYFTRVDVHAYGSLLLVFVLIAIASMVVGNLLALLQTNVKRILAYSSIAHLGYLLVAFLASGPLAVAAVAFYLVAYFVTTLGAFAVITLLSGKERDADRIEDYRGLFQSHPWLAGVFTAMLLSLAGIPLTVGFVGKVYLVSAGVSSALWLLAVVLVLTSAIGLFYYLRVIIAMYMAPAGEAAIHAPSSLPLPGAVVLGVLSFLLIALGIYPTPLIQLIEAMVGRLA